MKTVVGYLINTYPTVSHTFIRREISALEEQGLTVVRIALRRAREPLLDNCDKVEQDRTRYVMGRWAAARLFWGVVRIGMRTPMRLLWATLLALQMARGSNLGRLRHLAYLAEACVITRWLGLAGAEHLHAHFATNPAEIAMLIRALGGPPYSFTAHGSDILDRPAQVGLDKTVRYAEFVVAVCAFGRSQICKWVPENLWGRIHVIRCGLERGYGDAVAFDPKPPGRQLVCVGRLSKEKGQFILVDAVKQLNDRGVFFDVVLVGDGPMRGVLHAHIDELGLLERIRLVGAMDSNGVRTQILSARALVVSSLSEGLPVVIMEAMRLNRPVVAPYLGGIPELVRHGRNGWLYPAADTAALAQAMAECLDAGPEVLAEMGRAAEADVREMHDVSRESARLSSLFRSSTIGAHSP